MKPNHKNKTGAAGSQEPLSNVWARTGDRNPYLHNVFALLGVDPDEGEATFLNKLRRAQQRLDAGRAMTVHGRRIEETDLTRAQDLAASAVHFVAERLLFHTVHKVDRAAFEQHTETLEAISFERPEDLLPLPIRDLSILTRLLPSLEEVSGDEPTPLKEERFLELASPSADEEQVFDL